MRGFERVNTCKSGSNSSLAAEPRGVSTTTWTSPSLLRTGSLRRSLMTVPNASSPAATTSTPMPSAVVLDRKRLRAGFVLNRDLAYVLKTGTARWFRESPGLNEPPFAAHQIELFCGERIDRNVRNGATHRIPMIRQAADEFVPHAAERPFCA